ncbi:cupredoxin domain-containing protein [Candidatus Curtissbacteria bacterium]|nr:cupredoxin domain-containing protein [Candidatus Curtissbacteria bacterium]
MKRVFLVGFVATLMVLSACTSSQPAMQNESTGDNNTQTANQNAPLTQNDIVVVYTDEGFSPATMNIALGTKVMFENKSSKAFWPASGPHPEHTNYPEFDPKKSIPSGESYSFVFEKAGAWGFHDHLDSKKFGKITVE